MKYKRTLKAYAQLEKRLDLKSRRIAAMKRRIEVLENTNQMKDRQIARLQAHSTLQHGVIQGLQDQTNRDAEVINYLTKERKAHDNSRICPVCLQQYNGDQNVPHVLDCGHAVCRGCLERLIMPPQRPDLMPALRCPVCRKIGWADSTRARPVYAMMPGTLPDRPIHMDF
ncbi:unnamed protein product [Caenorhabditis nigoni]